MPRTLNANFETEIAKSAMRPVLFYEGVFSTQTLRLWTGVGSIDWNGETWLGQWIEDISGIAETSDMRATGMSILLSAVPQSVISFFLTEIVQGAIGRVYLGFIDSSNAIIEDPVLIFKGLVDIPTIEDDGSKASVNITYESELIKLQKSSGRRYTDEDQRQEYVTDKGFEHIDNLQDWTGFWGVTGVRE